MGPLTLPKSSTQRDERKKHDPEDRRSTKRNVRIFVFNYTVNIIQRPVSIASETLQGALCILLALFVALYILQLLVVLRFYGSVNRRACPCLAGREFYRNPDVWRIACGGR